MKIEQLKKPKGSNRRKKRLGRGSGSGSGKTSGRGHKGQMSRTGSKNYLGFEGGQMPLIRRLPKRGFNNKFAAVYQIINVDGLNKFKDGDTVTPKELKEANLISKINEKVKVLGKGEIKKSLAVEAHKFSKTAEEKIKQAKGTIKVIS